jgi:L-iditol 2-dehydrogenase
LETMKAAIYYGPGDIRVKEIERPHANPEGVVVKVSACGICNILDIPVWKNWPEGGRGVGLIRGHEFSGEIVEVGSEVSDFKVGERIFTEPIYRPCYKCEACRVKDYWRCTHGGENEIGKGINGAFAEYMAIPFLTKMSAIKLPDSLNYRDLALLDHLTLGAALARRVETDKVVVVSGLDITGIGAVALMKNKGVAKVIATDISKIRLNAAVEAGADMVIDGVNQDVVQTVMRETQGIGVDSVCVCDDRPIAVFQAMNMVRNMGKVWITRPEFFRLNPALIPEHAKPSPQPPESSGYKDLAISLNPVFASLEFGFGYGYKQLRFGEALELLQSGRCTAEKLVTQVFPLEKIKEAFETALNPHKSIKVLVEP